MIGKNLKRKTWLLLSLWVGYFLFLFARMFWVDAEGMAAGHWFVWGDWPLHIAQAMVFAEKDPSVWFAYHPVFADGQMTYPFLSNLLSGLAMRMGVPLVPAMLGQSMLLSVGLILGLYFFFRRLSGSEARALIATNLFLLAAGFGFIFYLNDLTQGGSFIPSEMISVWREQDWFSGNFVVGLLVPQRAFLLGIVLSLWSMIGLLAGMAPGGRKLWILLGGLAAGLLPIAHAHSLIALAFLVGAIFLVYWKRWRELAWYAIPAALLGALLIKIFILGGVSRPGFMAWHFGYAATSIPGWLYFWVRVWGLMIPSAAFGLWLIWRQRESRELRALGLGALLLFLVANLVRFQPILWDNSKIFLWVYLVFSLLAAEAVVKAWEKKRALGIGLLALLAFTGILELILLQRVELNTHRMMTKEELSLMEKVRQETGPVDRFLTATIHNHPVMIMGARPILMGYQGWVYNYGLEFKQTEEDISLMFAGGEEALPLLKKHRIKFVYLGPSERDGMKANEDFYLARFPVAFESASIRIFDVSR